MADSSASHRLGSCAWVGSQRVGRRRVGNTVCTVRSLLSSQAEKEGLACNVVSFASWLKIW